MGGVVKSIGKVVKGVVKAVVGVVKAVVNVVSSVVNFIAQPFMGLFGGAPDIPDAGAEANRQQGVLITQSGSTVQIPVVYGLRRVGGAITFAETGSTDNKYLWVAYALAEGPIEGLFDLAIDDNKLAAKYIPLLNNGQEVNVDEGRYNGRIKMRFSHGKFFSTPSSSTVGGSWNPCSDAPSWDSKMIYNGVATLFVRYEWKKVETQEDADNNPFGGSIPAIKTTIMGRKVANFTTSTHSTAYGSETESYSTNPARILLDYLRNPRYGKGLTNDDIDYDTFLKAKNKCDTSVTYLDSDSTSGPILTSNTVLDTGQTIFSNVKTLLMGFRAYMPYVQGKYKLKIEDAGNETDITSGVATIVATFNEDNIQGSVTYQAIERTAKYNVVQINYVDPDKEYSVESIIYPETLAERQTYIDKDGGRENKLEATFPTITNYAIAKDMARLLFNKSRFQESCSFTATSQALELEPGDNIRIQSKMLNFGTTPFRIVTMKINNDMTVDLGCVRNDDSLYPHTRVGEEDIVLPPYVPKGGEIYYPVIIGGKPVGLVPPKVAPVPITHQPPLITNTTPTTVSGAGVHNITVTGLRFKTGLTARFIGNDGTEITPTAVTINSEQELVMSTTSAMTDANQPYDIKITNSATFGSLSTTRQNCLNVDAVEPTPEPPIADPPIPEDPEDPIVTPPPSDPPPEEPDPPQDPPDPPPPPVTYDDFVEIKKSELTFEGDLVYATLTGIQPANNDYKQLIVYYKRSIATETVYQQLTVDTKPGANQEFTFRIGPLLKNSTYIVLMRVKYTNNISTFMNRVNISTSGAIVTDPQDFPQIAETGWPSDPGTPTVLRDTPFNSIVGAPILTGGNPKTPKEMNITIKQEINNAPANFDVVGVAYYIKASTASRFTRYTTTFDQSYVPGIATTFQLAAGSIGNPAYPSVPTAAQQQYDFVFRFLFKDGTESTKQSRYMTVNTERSGVGTYNYDPFYEKPHIKEDRKDFTIEIADPGAPSAASQMEVILKSVEASISGGYNHVRFFFHPPDASVQASWLGMRIRFRKVIPGTDPDFETYDSTSVFISGTSGLSREFVPIDFDQEYEFVITPVYNNSGARADSKKSVFVRGFVHNFQIRPEYPPTGNWLSSLNVEHGMLTSKALKQIDESFPAPPNPTVEVTQWKLVLNDNRYPYSNATHTVYKLAFNHHAVANFTQLNIYRRQNRGEQGIQSKGRWEKIQVTSLSGSPNDTTVYLRPPLSTQEFSGNDFVKYPIGHGYVVDATHGFTNASEAFDEFLLVAQTSSGEESVGLLLNGLRKVPLQGGDVDILQGVRPIERNVIDFNGFDSATQRNQSQAVAAITNANCVAGLRGKKWGDYTATYSPTVV